MFAVELGAALLLQFRTDNGPVRILADGGERGHGVDGKLASVLKGFDSGAEQRIDLMIGTHYDADHLEGLVEVVENTNVPIGEAWLPPVANYTQTEPGRSDPGDDKLLTLQLAREDGREVLNSYLRVKARECERLLTYEAPETPLVMKGVALMSDRDDSPTVDFFQAHIQQIDSAHGRSDHHADEEVLDPWREEDAFSAYYMRFAPWYEDEFIAAAANRTSSGPAKPTLALLRRAAAKDAINAKALADLVFALKNRGVPIACRVIPDGAARRFAWDAASRRFVPGKRLASDGPELLLLGPSEGLVRKHWRRLPVGDYLAKAEFLSIPLKPVTPSNQLSYVVRCDFDGQRVLITGDAGCADFKPGRNAPYYPDLI